MSGGEVRPTDSELRVSEAERDGAQARLQYHYAVGRLTLSELEERVAAAYRARTRGQLGALFRDLPAEAELRRPADPVDTRLLVILLCTSPPAALVYWLVRRRRAHRG